MKKHLFLFMCVIACYTSIAQNDQQKLKTLTLQAFEAVSPATRQWFYEVAEKHPAGDFDTTYAKNMIRGKFTTPQTNEMAEMFVVMMAYLKMVQKEAREDRKIARMSKEIVLASKEEKLKLDNKAINEGMQEAKEKADQAMQAAAVNLYTGIVSGLLQISGAAAGVRHNTIPVKKDTLKVKQPAVSSIKKVPASVYIKKLEGQLVVLKKAGI